MRPANCSFGQCARRHRSRRVRRQAATAVGANDSEGAAATEQPGGFGAAEEATPPSSFQPGSNGSAAEWQDDDVDEEQLSSDEEPELSAAEQAEQAMLLENMEEDERETSELAALTDEQQEFMQQQVEEYVSLCHTRYSIEDLVEVGLGAPNLACVLLRHPRGSEVQVFLHGANISSWTRGNRELLYLRPGNAMDGLSPIRGGIPIAFPQVGRGMLPTNGFLSSVHWSIAETGTSDPEIATDPAPSVALFTESDEATKELWPFDFEAMYTISLMEKDEFPDTLPPEAGSASAQGQRGSNAHGAEAAKQQRLDGEKVDDNPLQLRCVLEILNTDEKEFTFTTALQTHFAIEELGEGPRHGNRRVRLLGLGGKYTLDYAMNPSNPRLTTDPDDYIYFGDEVIDRVYVDTGDTDVLMCPGDRTHFQLINRQGFKDVAVTNPYTKARREYQDFLTMESARVARPVKLQPGESWVGEMVIRSYNTMWERPLFEFDQDQPSSAEPMPSTRGVDRQPARQEPDDGE